MADSRRIMFASTLQHSLAYPWLGRGIASYLQRRANSTTFNAAHVRPTMEKEMNSTATAMTFDNAGIARNSCAPIANGSKHAAHATSKFAVNA